MRLTDWIGIDYTHGPGHAPGVGRYVRELVRAIVRQPGSPPLALTEFGRGPTPMEGAPLGLEGPEVVSAAGRRRYRLPRRLLYRIEDWTGALSKRGWRGCRMVHRVHPEWPPAPRGLPHTLALPEFPARGSAAETTLGQAARDATGVIVFSQDAARRATEHLGVPAQRVWRVPVGADHWERDLTGDEEQRAPRDILVLGAIRRSRRPLEVLRAFEDLAAVRPPSGPGGARLLMVGRPGDAAPEFTAALRASAVRQHVRWIEDPIEARMPGCVAGAAVLLHLADDEASPVTPLEATRMGLPVVASPLPAFQEALPDGTAFVNGSDAHGVALALDAALDRAGDEAVRAGLRRFATDSTWAASARAHLAVWEPILGGLLPDPGWHPEPS